MDIQDFGFDSTSTLSMFFTITPTAPITLYTAGYSTSYPYFRFFVEGIDFTCAGINRFIFTFIDSGGTRYSSDQTASTACGQNYFEI